jgi:hypothetical protein
MSGQANPRDFLNPTAAILLPAGQAAVSAFAIGVTAGSVAILVRAENPWAIGGLAAGVGLGASWLLGLSWWRARVEGLRPEPAAIYPSETVRVEMHRNADSPWLWVDFLDLPIGRETMQAAAIDLVAKDFQTSNLGGRGKALTRSQGEALRDYLIARGLAFWVRDDAHTAGWGLGGAGRALVRRFALLDNPPTTHQAVDLPDGWHSL